MLRRRTDGNSSFATNTTSAMNKLRLRTVRFFGLGFSSHRQQRWIYIFGVIVVIWFIYYFYSGFTDENLDEILLKKLDGKELSSEKWIVMTTIHSPTKTVRALSLLIGWQVLVVGDRKTPESWSSSNVIYLDINKQKSLNYKVLRYLPYDTYTRKTIGYLFAIKHGAKYIYEVDDDNFPEDGLNRFQISTDQYTSHLVLVTNNLTCNPYVHFGQMSLWPRGYPLDRIGLPPDRTYDLCQTRTPAIQQGIVNGDPDIDALIRMTRKRSSTNLALHFDKTAPPFLLPPGTYAPFNTQNTFFQRKAFWAMVLPTLVPDRVSDIYRSYWAQRLLWLIGENLAFASPNAFQERSGHSNLADARDEKELYHGIGHYIKTLNEWQCSETTFFDCVHELTNDLIDARFWQKGDAELVDAWISDLTRIGYEPPELISQAIVPCVSSESLHVAFYPVEQNTTLPHDENLHSLPHSTNHEVIGEKLTSWCGPAHFTYWKSALTNARKYSDFLLIVSVYRNFETIVPVLETFYKPHFPQILYCTNRKVSSSFIKLWKISVLVMKGNVGAVSCITSAHKMHYNVNGYLHISEMMWMKAEDQLNMKHKTLMWLTGEFDAFKPRTLKLCDEKTIHCQFMNKDVLTNLAKDLDEVTSLSDSRKKKLRTCISKLEKDPTWVAQKELVWITDMAVYVPVLLVVDLEQLKEVFIGDQKMYDFITPLLLECEQLTIDYLEHSEELDSVNSQKGDYMFPFPFESVATDKNIKNLYCQHFEQYR